MCDRHLRCSVLGLSFCLQATFLTLPNVATAAERDAFLAIASSATSRETLQAKISLPFYFRPPEVPPQFTASDAQWNAQSRHIQFWIRNTGTLAANPRTRWTLTKDGIAISSGNIDATPVIQGTRRRFDLFDLTDMSDRAMLPPGEYELVGELSWRFEAQDYSQPFALPFMIQSPSSGQLSSVAP